MCFVASLVGILVAGVVCRRRVRLFEVLLAATTVALACTSRRHLALYAVVVPALAAGWVARSMVREPATRRRTALALALGALSVVFAMDVARGSFYRRCGPPRTLGLGFDRADVPAGAVEFVARQRLPGPLFNNVAAGSYIAWRLRGDPPALVDGRLLDSKRFSEYRHCLESMPAFDAFAAARGTRTVVLALQPYAPVQLFRHLYTTPPWRLAYLDAAGAVFAPDSVVGARGLSPVFLERELPAASAPVGLSGSWWRQCDTGEAGRRGELLLRLGFAAPASTDLARALAHCPQRWEVGLSLSTALLATGRAEAARPLVERALDEDPGNIDAWVNAGLVSRAAGDLAGARDAWQRAAALAPRDPRPARLLRELGP
jgi:hypothetical protein